jgi:hypothetical protein
MVDPSALAKLIAEKYQSSASQKSISNEQDRKFLSTLRGVSNTVFMYEDDDLLDYALEILPLEDLYAKAEKREAEDSSWGLQDYLVMELLRWFKQDFFKWVNHPKCSKCGGDTKGIGSAAPNDYERSGGAGIVELSECPNCRLTERFPRYNQPKRLLQTRQGRCGEWANVSQFLSIFSQSSFGGILATCYFFFSEDAKSGKAVASHRTLRAKLDERGSTGSINFFSRRSVKSFILPYRRLFQAKPPSKSILG